ncbi:MAG: DUF2807 domain-containing protein [Cyclobacteriaceae bacterium]|nr:DUF2807 domain-containing protein [Cyclobacteriaceae bacterium]
MTTTKGNGILMQKMMPVSSFLHLHLSVNGQVELYQSDEERVEFEADENLIDYVTATNSGRTLYVTAEAGYRGLDFTSLKVKVYFRQLAKMYVRCEHGDVISKTPISQSCPFEVKIQSGGNVILQVEVPALKMLIQSHGDVILRGKCIEADIKTQAEGNLFARELIAEDVRIRNMSEGNVEVMSNRTISIAHFGEGYVHYYGNGKLIDVNQKGEGEIIHKRLIL